MKVEIVAVAAVVAALLLLLLLLLLRLLLRLQRVGVIEWWKTRRMSFM